LAKYTASIGQNVVHIRRSSHSTEKTFVSLANGGINTSDAFFDGSSYFVTTFYDQTGNGIDLTQTTAANQPTFLLATLGSLPIARFVKASGLFVTGTGAASQTQPFSIAYAAKNNRIGAQ